LFVSPGFAGRAGSFRACAETFRQYLAEKIAFGELFRQAQRLICYGSGVFFGDTDLTRNFPRLREANKNEWWIL